MGDRGYNAGGFAYMARVACRHCGRRYPIGCDDRSRTCIKCRKDGKERITIGREEDAIERTAFWKRMAAKRQEAHRG